MRVSCVLVHYRTPDLVEPAIDALRADARAAGVEAEWLVVDNGSDEAGRERLRSLPVRLLEPGANLGYAGGVNLGVGAARGEVLLVANPDVLVRPGCLAALLEALAGGAQIAGPRFFWDRGERLLQPPAQQRTRFDEALAVAARHRPAWAARARRRWRRHARRHWQATAPLPSHALPGALLAFRRTAWEAVGPFDEGYPLYFEETDWLGRAARRGVAARHVPAAHAVHLYDRSAGAEPRAAGWFAESAGRYRRAAYGAWFPPLLSALDRRLALRARAENPPPPAPPEGIDLAPLAHRFPLWLEVSPRPEGFPAAAERLAAPPSERWKLPEEIATRLAGVSWTVRAVDSAGREHLCRTLPAAAR